MAKPASIPTWNTGGANNVAPSGAEQISGWITNQIPASSKMNWLQKLYGDWITWLDTALPNSLLTARAFAFPPDFTSKVLTTGGTTAVTYTMGTTTTMPQWLLHAEAGGVVGIDTHIPIPAGAVITGIDILMDNDNSGDTSDYVEAFVLTKAAADFTAAAVKNAYVNFGNVATKAWAAVPSITSQTIPTDGLLYVRLRHSDPDHDLIVYGVRVTYTITRTDSPVPNPSV